MDTIHAISQQRNNTRHVEALIRKQNDKRKKWARINNNNDQASIVIFILVLITFALVLMI